MRTGGDVEGVVTAGYWYTPMTVRSTAPGEGPDVAASSD